jgi:lipopolysaccharide transport system ATP-binding protein
VQQGDVLGIIGKNGSGKSTLLKILSKITAPTTGAIHHTGRIAALLEVGTGFHPEMTGRENIYLNGAILGMTKQEISRKLDEIIDFSGIERYIDTPSKRYSSGMYVRLGFAIAAHLDPEIMIVDEVLAVGDAEFQKKAIGKMQDVSQGKGRTVLFVSHNMASIKKLCTSGLVLSNGNTVFSGEIREAVDFYIADNYTENPHLYFEDLSTAPGNENIRIKSFEVTPILGKELNVESGINFNLHFYNYKPNIMMDTTFELSTIDDICIFHIGKVLSPDKDLKVGMYEVQFKLPPDTLNAGKFKMKLIFGENQKHVLWMNDNVLNFEVENTLKGQGFNMAIMPGVLKPKIDFSHNYFK